MKMIIIKPLSINFKNKIKFISFLLICGLLLNTYSNLKGSILFSFFEDLTATISVSNTSVCKAESVTITFEGAGGEAPYKFVYKINDVEQDTILSNSENLKTLTLNNNSAGDFRYILTYIKDNKGESLLITDQEVTIKVNSPPVVDFTFNNNEACSGETIQFTNNSTGTGGLTYSWDFGDGTTSTQTSPNRIFEALGCGNQNFTVKLTVTDENECSSSTTKSITVKQKPDIEFFDADFKNFDNCGNASTNYTINLDNSSNSNCINNYFIDWGDGNTESITTFPISHNYTEISVFNLKIKATANNGCVNEVSYEVKNVSNPAGGLASPGSTSNICLSGSELTFPVTNYEGNSDDTEYTLDFGDGSPKEIYTHAEIISNNKITHKYIKGSCNTFGNQFIAVLSIENACSITESTINNIVILEPSVSKFDSTDISCINKPIIFTNSSVIGDNPNCSTAANFKWDFGDGTIVNVSNTNSITNQTHAYSSPGTYTATLSVTSNCGTDVFSKQICIEPEITPTFDVSLDKGCIPLNITTTNTADESKLCSSTPTYKWTIDYISDNCGTASDWEFTNSTNKNSENPAFIFKNSGKYTLTQSITTGCGTEITSKVIDVKKPPTASINPISDSCGAFTFNPVATINNCTDDTTGITYNWTFSGGSPANSNTLKPGDITFNAPGIHAVTLEVTSECGVSNKATQSFEIFEIPIITNTDLTQEICSNQSTSEISFITSNASTTYSWSANASANVFGYTSNGNSKTIPVQTLVNNSNTVGTVTYTVIPKTATCEGDAVDFITTVNSAPIITTQPISSEICLDGTTTELEVAYQNGTGSATYQWFSNINSPNPWGNPIFGATNSTFDPPTNTVGKLHYYAEISFTSGGCSKIVSAVATVNVVEQIVVNPAAAAQTICVGGTANEFEVTYSGGTGNPSYQWFKNTSNTTVGGTKIESATNATYLPDSFSNIGVFYYYVEVSVEGNGCSSATSDVYQIEVVSDPIIDSQPITFQELCQGSSPADLIVTASVEITADKIYQWFSNTSSSTTDGTLISGETSDTFTPPTLTVGTFYYYVVINQPESGCEVISEVSTLKINEAPVFTTQPTSSEICLNGTATTLEVAYTNGTGIPTYEWFSNINSPNPWGNRILGATNSTFDPPTNTVGKLHYYAKISFTSGGCSKIVSAVATVNVVEQIVVNPVAAGQTICVGGTANEFEVTYSGGTGNPSYQWFSNDSNTNTGGTVIPSAITDTYTPATFSTSGNFYFYAEVSLTGNGCTLATSDVFQVDVLTDPVIDSQAIASQELCRGAAPTDLTVVVSGGTASAKTYQWYQNSTSNSTRGTAIPGATASSFAPSTATVGTLYYYVIVSQLESGCSVLSNVSLVKVNEAPIITTQPISSEICVNGTATQLEVAYQNGTGSATYQWFSNTSDDITSGTEIVGEINTAYNPLTDTVGTLYYYVEISFSSGGCLKIVSNTASVIVNEIPAINNAEVTIYSESTFNFNPNSIAENTIPNGTKYTWSAPTFNPVGKIIGASAETNPQEKISQTLENTGKTPIKVTYTITPATTECTGTSFILEVTVNPSINSNAVVVNNNCFESNDGAISTNIDGGIPFTSGDPYLISWIGPNGFTATSANITNLEAGLYALRIEDKNGISITEELMITQPDVLSITKDVEKNISCFQGNDGAIEVTISGGTNPYTYNWSTTGGSGIVTNSKNQNTLTAGTYTLEIVDKNNCKIATNFILTEPEVLKIETVSKQDILCFGDVTGAIEINISGGTQVETSSSVFDYLYSWSGPNGYTSTSKNITNLLVGTYTVVVIDNLGCTISATFIIDQSTEIKINFEKTNVTCYKANDGTIKVTVSGGKAPHQISWSNLASGFSLSNLSAETYIATIIDVNNCTAQVSIIIEEPVFFIEPVVTPISCNGENDAVIKLNLSGGIAPFSVTWNDGSTEGLQRNNLAAGTYSVVILDSDTDQCPIERTFIITNPPLISLSTTLVDAIDCDIVNSGSIDLETSGGTAPYTFKWSTNETTEGLKNIPPGDYSVEITDANGCTISRQFNIFRQEPITIIFEEITITDCDLKIVSKQNKAKVAGGFLPYTYSWSAGIVSGSNDEIMTTSQNGSYILTITDAKGCEKSNSFIVNVPTIGSADFRYNAFALTTYNFLSIEDPIQFINLTTGDFTSLKWDFGDGSATTNEENPVHTYNSVGSFDVVLTVEFTQGCLEVFERTITITQGYSLIHPTAFSPNDDGYNETIRPSYRGFTNIKMTIYDTWGTTVYQEEGVNLKGWNGLINGKPAENGNYVMFVRGTTFYEKEIIKSSPVTLLK
jgi:gliding motility-associated-like protein